ncbi:MAG: glycosyltransferase domain-containing protein [bacterium]
MTSINNNHNLVVYTALFGGKDTLVDPTYVDPSVDYVCFTDDPTLTSSVYKMVLCDSKFKTPIQSAKQFKLLPHLFFPEYTHSLWVDASIVIKTDDMKSWLDPHIARNNFTVFQNTHPTLSEEIQYLKDAKKVRPEDLDRQIAQYTQEGLSLTTSMVDGSTILRAHNNPDVIKFDELWWDQICKHTLRDEVSFAYVKWKLCFNNGTFDHPSRHNNPWVYVRNHRIEEVPLEGVVSKI